MTSAALTVSSYAPVVELRPLERGDHVPVLEVFAGLSARSRALRFLTPKPRLTGPDVRQLTDVDQHDHVAIVAAVDGRAIGVARFVRDPAHSDSADVAVAVVDHWQNRGVGTMLTDALEGRARELGVRRFTMVMAPDNEGAVRLLHRSSGEIERLAIDDEAAEFAVTLADRPMTGATARTARRSTAGGPSRSAAPGWSLRRSG